MKMKEEMDKPGMLDRIWSLFSKRQSPENPKTPLSVPAEWLYDTLGGKPTVSGSRINEKTALQISTVWACVEVISQSIASLPLFVYKPLEPKGREKAVNQREYNLLHNSPNERMTSCIFREVMTIHVMLWGNAYALIEYDRSGKTRALWPILPYLVVPELLPDRSLQYIVKDNITGTERPYPAADIIHIPGLSFDGVSGVSPIKQHREGIGLAQALEQFGAEYFGNGTSPSGVLQAKGRLSVEAKERLSMSWKMLHTGPGNRHKVPVLEEDVNFSPITLQADHAQFIESRKFQISEIARIFRVPAHMVGDLERATFCLPADVKIFTEHGPKSISDIKSDERVWSIGSNRRPVLSRVLRSGSSGEDEILEINARGRTLRCNAKHRVLVRREIYERYQGGRGKSVLIDGIKYRHFHKTEYIPAGEIREGDYLISPVALPDQGGQEAPTRKADVPFMESLGMILGDGFFARCARTGKGSTFGISHSRDASYLPAYINAIQSSFQACDGPYGMRNGGTAALVAKRRDETTTVFYSTLAYDELERCGIIGTSKTKRVPEWIFGLSRELKLAFIRGYLDADGTVTKTGHIRFVSVNYEMIEQFRHLCIDCGIRVGNVFSAEIKSNFDAYGEYTHILYQFVCTDPRLNAEIGTHTPMYRERIQTKISNRKKRVVKIFNCEAQRNRNDAEFRYHKVFSITRSPCEPVYDLEIEGSHNFLADGVVVHNSNIEQQSLEFVEYTLRPWLVRWEQELNRKLFPKGDHWVEFNIDGLLRGDVKTRMDAYATGRQWGWLSVNEIREKENLNPLPAEQGDVYLSPLNMVEAGTQKPPTPPKGGLPSGGAIPVKSEEPEETIQ